jgi:hypothetical protein
MKEEIFIDLMMKHVTYMAGNMGESFDTGKALLNTGAHLISHLYCQANVEKEIKIKELELVFENIKAQVQAFEEKKKDDLTPQKEASVN